MSLSISTVSQTFRYNQDLRTLAIPFSDSLPPARLGSCTRPKTVSGGLWELHALQKVSAFIVVKLISTIYGELILRDAILRPHLIISKSI